MTNATLTFKGREYILVPRPEYERLTAADQDRLDAAKAKKTLAKFRAGKLKTVSHATLKRQLGL